MKIFYVLPLVFLHQSLLAKTVPIERRDDGFRIQIGAVSTEVHFLTDHIARVRRYPGATPLSTGKSLVVRLAEKAALKIRVQETRDYLLAFSPTLKVKLNKANGQLRFFDGQGKLLLAEIADKDPFIPTDDDGRTSYRISQSYLLAPDEAIYGLGQHQNGKMNQRHQRLLLKQKNMEIAIPFFQSTKGYGLYWDNYSGTVFQDSLGRAVFTSEIGDNIDYYFLAGNKPDDVVRRYRELTGHVPMLPLWSFGYLQSRERYRSQEELIAVVGRYRQLGVPLDGIIQDWQYWGEDKLDWNGAAFNHPRFPEPKKMIDSVHKQHARLLISVWPSFGSHTSIYRELEKGKMLYPFLTYPVSPQVKVYDAFHPEARKIYWKYLNDNLFSAGIDGWWLDATEPVQKEVSTAVQNGPELAYKDRIDSPAGISTYLGSFRRMGNAFPLMTVEGVYEGQRGSSGVSKRPLILTRSAFAGQQRTGSVLWSGDIQASWLTLKKQVPLGLNLSLTGMPYWNSDIGGFFTSKNYPEGIRDPTYAELYIRWLQFAVFTGMMRSHGTNTPREIYQFGQPGDLVFDILRKYIGLRYRLLPYIYSSAWSVSSQALSLMRPLVMAYPEDRNGWELGTEYLFGPSLLVAPVTDSLFARGATALDLKRTLPKEVYLPHGEWIDFWTNRRLTGGKKIIRHVSLDEIPVFVKAGSIVPFAEEAPYASIKHFQSMEIRVYPGRNTSYVLYEDEGDGFDYLKGGYSLIRFTWNEARKELLIGDRTGDFNSMVPERQFKVSIKGTNLPSKTIRYNGTAQVVAFK